MQSKLIEKGGGEMDFYSILLNKNLGGSVNTFKLFVSRNLTNVTEEMLDEITKIRDRAFEACRSLTSIEIPKIVTSIGDQTFKYCDSLTSVTVLRTTPPTLGTNAFADTPSSLKIYVPSASVNAYKTADGWKDYASQIQAIPS